MLDGNQVKPSQEWEFTGTFGFKFDYIILRVVRETDPQTGVVKLFAETRCSCVNPPDHIPPPDYQPTGALLDVRELQAGRSGFGTWRLKGT